MQHLLLVNPGGRKRRRKTAGRKRRRGRRTMTAKQRKYFGPRKRRSPRRRTHHVARRRRRSHSLAPARRRRSYRRRVHHIRRRRRGNPFGGGFIASSAMCAAVGVVGALVTDMAWSFIPLPATIKSGNVGALAKAGASIVLGMFASKAIGSKLAKDATIGALTVQLYGIARPMLASAGVPGLGYYGAGYSLNAFVPNSLMDYTDISDTKNYPTDVMDGLGRYLSDTPNSLNAYLSDSYSDISPY